MAVANQLIDSYQRRWDALLDNDLDTLRSLLHDDLSHTHADSRHETKAQFLASVISGDLRYVEVSRTEEKVTTSGSSGIITGLAHISAEFRGAPASAHIRFSSTWVLSDNWTMICWHASPVPDQA